MVALKKITTGITCVRLQHHQILGHAMVVFRRKLDVTYLDFEEQ